jgi:hypothetical protein
MTVSRLLCSLRDRGGPIWWGAELDISGVVLVFPVDCVGWRLAPDYRPKKKGDQVAPAAPGFAPMTKGALLAVYLFPRVQVLSLRVGGNPDGSLLEVTSRIGAGFSLGVHSETPGQVP